MSALRRAAFTRWDAAGSVADSPAVARACPELRLVHSGIDPARALNAQGDSFWRGSAGFARVTRPTAASTACSAAMIRGTAGSASARTSVTLDGGGGFGGPLVCAHLSQNGDVLELIERCGDVRPPAVPPPPEEPPPAPL